MTEWALAEIACSGEELTCIQRDVLLFLLELSSNVVSCSSAQFASKITAWLMVLIKGPWGDRICVVGCDLKQPIKFIFSQPLRLLQKICGLLQLTKVIWTTVYWVVILLCVLTDIHECNKGLGDCDLNATCMNTYGSYVCMCNSGFTGNGFIWRARNHRSYEDKCHQNIEMKPYLCTLRKN